MKTIVKINNLVKEFTRIKRNNFFKDLFFPEKIKSNAVEDISFEIFEGENVAFLGPNGAGKTTTIKMICGLIYPTSGEVNVLGFIPTERQTEFLKRIGLVMGNKAGLSWDLTANQSFKLIKEIYDLDKTEFEENLKELVEILDVERLLDVQIRKLSLGERMKMELIGSILHKPKLLVLDEPTIGLDIISKQKIREFLKNLKVKNKTTLILTSHDMDDIENICERVILINKGKKIYDGDLKALMNKYNNFKTIKIYSKRKIDKLPDIQGELLEQSDFYAIYKVPSDKVGEVLKNIGQTFDLDDIDILSVPLEEVIREVFSRS